MASYQKCDTRHEVVYRCEGDAYHFEDSRNGCAMQRYRKWGSDQRRTFLRTHLFHPSLKLDNADLNDEVFRVLKFEF